MAKGDALRAHAARCGSLCRCGAGQLCWPWGDFVDEPWLRVVLAAAWFVLFFWG
ncbi:MAG: hypothetical protein R3B47_20690 [Bacteroidia bacterium]